MANHDRRLNRCRFDGPEEIGWIVYSTDGAESMTTPFLARDEEHARKWVAQPLAQKAGCQVRKVVIRRCHCGEYKVVKQAK